jgi:TolA-binding protein
MLSKYRLLVQLIGALSLLALVIGIGYWVVSPRIDLQRQRADAAEESLGAANALIEVQARVLEGHQRLLGELSSIRTGIAVLGQTVNQNQRQQSAALEELKRNDKTVAEYLGLAVPADLGLLYARPETTDPAAYRAASAVRPDPLLPTGSSAYPHQ